MSARFRGRDVCRALDLPDDNEDVVFTSVSTDTRAIVPGALFVALRGPRFDGAAFLADAARAGARGAVVRAGTDLPDLDLAWFPVEDTLDALGRLARLHRNRAGARVIGLTGSSGKTTVKELLARAAGEERQVHATPGNFNNLVGVPLTILSAPAGADVWIVEMGTSEPGEIARLTRIAEPDDALVTTVGPAHLEGLGGPDGVLREKLDLVRHARSGGWIVVGDRPPELARAAREIRSDVRVAGLEETADWRPERWEVEAERVTFERAGTRYQVPAGGRHHLQDAVLAAAAADALGIAPEAVARGLASYRPVGMRGAVLRYGDLVVLADCYNANPESIAAAVRWCEEAFADRRRIAVVSTMLELGSRSADAHAEAARRLVDAGFALVVAMGEFRAAFDGLERTGATRVVTADDVSEALDALERELAGGEVVLVKASRGERLERVVEGLAARHARAEA